jgi:uncharacterized protein
MKIGLISDTHGYLDSRVFKYFEVCDEIWHAGDIGDLEIMTRLEQVKPVRAVFGNIDDLAIRHVYPEDLWMTCEGVSVWMTHIAGSPPNYNPRIKKKLAVEAPDILICGHSHILRIKRDERYGNMLYVNPGAAGNHGFHRMKTLVRFTLADKTIKDMEVIELGRRGEIVP